MSTFLMSHCLCQVTLRPINTIKCEHFLPGQSSGTIRHSCSNKHFLDFLSCWCFRLFFPIPKFLPIHLVQRMFPEALTSVWIEVI